MGEGQTGRIVRVLREGRSEAGRSWVSVLN